MKRGVRGEMLVETLVSLIIAALAMTMLAGAIVSSGKTNAAMTRSHSTDQRVFAELTKEVEGFTLTVGGDKATGLNLYTDAKGEELYAYH